MSNIEIIKNNLKHYADFPKPGIDFVDVFSLFHDPKLVDQTVDLFVDFLMDKKINKIAALDSRGFILGPIICQKMNLPFIPIRKKGKLPGKCVEISYSLEYGKDVLEISEESVKQGENIAIIDDLMATGGTMSSAMKLVKLAGGNVVYGLTLIELDELKGRSKLESPFHAFVHF